MYILFKSRNKFNFDLYNCLLSKDCRMSNLATLLPPFTTETRPTPVNPGRKAGTKNRRTMFKEWLGVTTDAMTPTGELSLLSQAEQIILAMIERAKKGDVNAAYFCFDNAYGKLDNKQPLTDTVKPAIDLTKLTSADLIKLKELTLKMRADNNSHIDEAEIIE